MSHHYYSDGHYSENNLQDHYEDVNPTVAVVLCSIALTLAILLCCTWFWTWVYVQDDWTVSWLVNDETACSLCTCLTLFFIAMCVLTAYSGQLRRRDEQDYYGKMRITNVTYEHRVETVEDGNEITDWEHFYEARYTLDWGYEWACPSMSLPSGYKECPASSLIACTHKICKKEHCKQSEIDEAVRATMECTLQSYDPMQNYTSYEPRQGPSQDVDWPHVVAYGDCETCSVYWSVASPEKLANERTAGLVLLGVTAAALCVVAWQVCGILKPSENDKPPMIVEEPDIEVVVTADINDFDKPLVPEAEIEVLPQCTKEEKIKCAECRVTKLRALFSPQQLQTNNPVCRNCAGVSRPPATNPDFVEPTQVGNEPSSKVMFACVSCGIEKPSKDFDPEQVGKPIPQCRLCTVNIEKSFDKPDDLVEEKAERCLSCGSCGVTKPYAAFNSTQIHAQSPKCRICTGEIKPTTASSLEANSRNHGEEEIAVQAETHHNCSICGTTKSSWEFSKNQLSRNHRKHPKCKSCVATQNVPAGEPEIDIGHAWADKQSCG